MIQWSLALLLLFSTAASAQVLIPYSPERFQTAQKSGKVVVLQFHSSTAELSNTQAKAIASLLEEPDETTPIFLQVSYEGEEVLRTLYKVTAPSTLLVFRGPRFAGKTTGVFRAQEILSFVEGALSRDRARPRPRAPRVYRPKR